MPVVLPVKCKFSAHELWFNPASSNAHTADHVICNTSRGHVMGVVVGEAYSISDSHYETVCGTCELKSVVRVATDADLEYASTLSFKASAALDVFNRLVDELKLDMKPVGVEYMFSGDSAVCYFVADDRIDFRQLVRALGHELGVRVDMHQLGIREQSALAGGFAHCGQELCCARFGHGFDSVSIRMAKEQDLPLNAAKISGACGRLMCCLRYEFEAYHDFKKRAPKPRALISTPLGVATVIEHNTPKEEIALRLEDGKRIVIALRDMDTSPQAHGHGTQQGCTCRPNRISHDALARLDSPEIKKALAELEAKRSSQH